MKKKEKHFEVSVQEWTNLANQQRLDGYVIGEKTSFVNI